MCERRVNGRGAWGLMRGFNRGKKGRFTGCVDEGTMTPISARDQE